MRTLCVCVSGHQLRLSLWRPWPLPAPRKSKEPPSPGPASSSTVLHLHLHKDLLSDRSLPLSRPTNSSEETSIQKRNKLPTKKGASFFPSHGSQLPGASEAPTAPLMSLLPLLPFLSVLPTQCPHSGPIARINFLKPPAHEALKDLHRLPAIPAFGMKLH